MLVNGFININNPVKLKGITANAIPTLGIYEATLQFKDMLFKQNFHLVTSAFPISQDDLIGRDYFLQKTLAILDYSHNAIQLVKKINYPFNANFQEISDNSPISNRDRFNKLRNLL